MICATDSTTYFNFKRERSGHLLQGRYKAILIEADEYAKELSRYIHLNPVRFGAVKSPQEYPWSSYRNYCGEKKAPEWLKTDFILGIFGKGLSAAQKSYREFVEGMVGQEEQNPLKELVFSTILGSKGFVKAVIDKYVGEKKADREVPALRKLKEQVSIEEIEKATEVVFGQEEKTRKKVSIYLSQCLSGRKLKEIGEYFELSESGVAQTSLRLEKMIEEDRKLERKVGLIKNRLKL